MNALDLIVTYRNESARVAALIVTWSGARLVQTIRSMPEMRLLVVDTSQRGWPLAKGWNYGIDRLLNQEGYEAVVVLNDDVVLRKDTIANLVIALKWEQFDRGAKPELLMTTGRNVRPERGAPFDQRILDDARIEWTPGPDFSCFCVDERLLKIVGPFDEQFVPAYFEDNDMHRRIFLAGFEGGAVTPYWHFGSTTIETDTERRHEIQVNGRFEENREKYIRKWGGQPHQERYAMPYDRPPAGFISERG